MQRKNIEVSGDAAGAIPEEVLVLETVGDVADFVGAVRNVSGLEWLLSADLLEVDEGDEVDAVDEIGLPSRLFALSTNLAALRQVLALWNRHKDRRGLPRNLGAWKGVFDQLRDVRAWSASDRIDGTGVVGFWEEALLLGIPTIDFAVEFWFRALQSRRDEAFLALQRTAGSLGGRLDRRFEHPETAFHGAIASLPAGAVAAFLETPESSLFLQQPQIRFCRPHGQAAAPSRVGEAADDLPEVAFGTLSEPVAALLDGLPIEGHLAYSGSLRLDDPDNWAETYPVAERVHGTAMASLIIRGDLNEPGPPLTSSLYVRPILRPDPLDWTHGPRLERVPAGRFPQDGLNIAIRRMKLGPPGGEPSAPTVLVVNLSIGDPSRCFVGEMSPWARMVDYLAHRHNLLFIVSGGNHRVLPMESTLTAWEALEPADQEAAVIKACWDHAASRRLLSPAEAMNALTVGAQHHDSSGAGPHGTTVGSVPIQDRSLASPVSALGPGFRRSVKPDLLFPGGRQVMMMNPNSTLECSVTTRRPGLKVAAPNGAGTRSTAFDRGTSHAAALATRQAVRVIEVLRSIGHEEGLPIPSSFLPVLAKALLGHGASAAGAAVRLREILDAPDERGDRFRRRRVIPMVGYGSVDPERTLGGDDGRATLVGWGELRDGEAHEFRFPIPPSLNAVTDMRRLTITLGWLSPINAMSRVYRCARLWVDPPEERLRTTRTESESRTVRNGTLQHEIFEGDSASVFAEGADIVLRVNCKVDTGTVEEPIRYGLAVSIESPTVLTIYEEVRSAIAVRAPVAT